MVSDKKIKIKKDIADDITTEDIAELIKAELRARKWEKETGLSGDCIRAYAYWKVLKKLIPELDGTP